VQKFHAVPKTISKVRGNGDAGSRFDGRHNGGKTVVLLFVNSRRIRDFLPRSRRAQIALHNFFSLVNPVLRTPLAFGKLMPRLTKGVHQP
jgi:hypothetical protein